jgi:DnaJ-class molecular chaperone
MSDPYKILGVARDASADDLKKAYRKLAKKLHPDLNPGDNTVEQRFKEVSQAYGILGDADKRKRFDRGEINASGQETAPAGAGGFYRRYAGTGKGAKYNPFDFTAEFGAEDILSEMFGRRGGRRGTVRSRGQDVSYSLDVDFLQAIIGGKTRLRLADNKTLDVTLAPGTEDGQTLRLKGQGMAGMGEAPRRPHYHQGQATPLFLAQWRHHPPGTADHPPGSRAGRERSGANGSRQGRHEDPGRFQHRWHSAAQRQGRAPRQVRQSRRPARQPQGHATRRA